MEITSNAVQTVAANQDVLFTNVAVPGNSSTVHRNGSGQVTLRGLTNCQCRARFRVTFGGNIAVPADGTAGPISLAIAIDGEPINSFGAIFIDIPRGCCGKVSVRNISTIPVSVQNANLIVERVA